MVTDTKIVHYLHGILNLNIDARDFKLPKYQKNPFFFQEKRSISRLKCVADLILRGNVPTTLFTYNKCRSMNKEFKKLVLYQLNKIGYLKNLNSMSPSWLLRKLGKFNDMLTVLRHGKPQVCVHTINESLQPVSPPYQMEKTLKIKLVGTYVMI